MASSSSFWRDLENSPVGTQVTWSQVLDHIQFNEQGLITAVAQQADTGEVLMLAWMNRESLEITLREGRACYWSRSRQQLWRKGESSGQVQWLKSIKLDCDGDALLLQVDQLGPACHTGRKSCFYFDLNSERIEVTSAPLIDPKDLYQV